MVLPFDGVPVGDDPLLVVADAISTLDADCPTVRALLVKRRRIAWVGDDPDEVNHLTSRRVDLTGASIQPAFVNAHTHLTGLGLMLDALDVGVATSLDDCLAAVRATVDVTPDPLIWGIGWDETNWPEHRPPSADELTAAAQGRPVILTRSDGHCVVVDRTSLSALPLARSRGVERNNEGEATGLLRQEAAQVAQRWFAALLPATTLDRARHIASRSLAAAGVASAHEMGGPHKLGPADFDAWLEGEWPIEIIGYWGDVDIDFSVQRGLPRVGGSLLLDGTIGSHSAALAAPYEDWPGSGNLYRDSVQLREFALEAAVTGLQVALHAIGDRAVDQAIDVFESVKTVTGPDQFRRGHHRLEYAALVDDQRVRRLAALGVIVTAQPASDLELGVSGGAYEQRLGSARAEAANPLGTLARAGVRLAFGADDFQALDPWASIQAATGPHHAESSMTHDQALAAATLGGRVAARQTTVGALRVGNRADFAAFEGGPDSPGKCIMTMVAGTVVHGASLMDGGP